MSNRKILQLLLIAAGTGAAFFFLRPNANGGANRILQKATNNERSVARTPSLGGRLSPVVNPFINDEPTAFNESLLGITPVTTNPVARGTPVDDNIVLFPQDQPRPRVRNTGSTSGFDVNDRALLRLR